MHQLSLASLDRLPDGIGRPSYSRGDLSAGIVHFGVGNFHRAHQASYLDRLINSGKGGDWAILGAGVMDSDSRMQKKLRRQDFLSTVVEQSSEDCSARVIGSIIGFPDPKDPPQILGALAKPEVRIVSLTVTEGGYFIDPVTGKFDASNQQALADIESPKSPSTVFGMIAAGLKIRREKGIPPFTVVSCDNVHQNGEKTRNAVLGLVELSDAKFAEWVASNVAFPSSMVDRITPATGPREIERVRAEFGIDDDAPVFCEEFSQWVLEDDFPAGRPELELVGVQMVDDARPFETMKMRILNGGHAAMSYPAALMGIEFAHTAMWNPLIRAYLDQLMTREIIPMIPAVHGTDFWEYYSKITKRIMNRKLGDTVARLCQDGSDRQPKFLQPTMRERLERGMKIDGLALATAFWCRYCYGENEAKEPIEVHDESAVELRSLAADARKHPEAFLEFEKAFSGIADSRKFREAFHNNLTAVWDLGTREVLKRYVSDSI